MYLISYLKYISHIIMFNRLFINKYSNKSINNLYKESNNLTEEYAVNREINAELRYQDFKIC